MRPATAGREVCKAFGRLRGVEAAGRTGGGGGPFTVSGALKELYSGQSAPEASASVRPRGGATIS